MSKSRLAKELIILLTTVCIISALFWFGISHAADPVPNMVKDEVVGLSAFG